MADLMTMDLLKEVTRDIVTPELSEHEKRLERVLGQKALKDYSYRRHSFWARRMQEQGFRLVVDIDWALKFKHHASIDGDCVFESRGSRRTIYQYCGDIPEFALDKLEIFLGGPLNIGVVSIHSMQPLPVKLLRSLPVVDPVMIGWAESPRFSYKQSGWVARNDPLGVVIAVWDGDKEIEVI